MKSDSCEILPNKIAEIVRLTKQMYAPKQKTNMHVWQMYLIWNLGSGVFAKFCIDLPRLEVNNIFEDLICTHRIMSFHNRFHVCVSLRWHV